MNMKIDNLIYIFLLLFAINIQDVSAQNDTVLYYNFATACATPPSGWSIQNVDGSCTWRCSDGGITQNNHTSYGCQNAANDWLISPPLPLNGYKNEILNFTTGTQYSGGSIAIKYSTNYPGIGDPTPYTWSTFVATFPGASGNVDLSGISGDSVYVAFQYISAGNQTGQASRWTVFDIIIKGSKTVTIVNPISRNIDSTSAILGAEVKLTGGSPILERGVIWSLSANPKLTSPGVNRIPRSGSLGVFDTIVNNLPSGTLINFRGYAFNSTDTSYTGNATFYTLDKEPAAHVTNFTATTNSSRSIVLNWTPSATANGYVILQKITGDPLAVPIDAVKYNKYDLIGDAVVADTIFSGATATDTIRNLLTGTRYHFSIIPLNIHNNLPATTNYYTTPVIPTASDSTWGSPYSTKSDIRIVAGSESNGISSVQNTAGISLPTDGEAVLKLAFRDGGSTLNDADDMPTIFTGFTIYSAVSNTVSNWQNVIQSIGLFDDSTGARIGNIVVNPGNISIAGLNIAASDNNYRTATLRLSLKTTTPVTDNTVFHFQLSDTSVATQSIFNSSQLHYFYTSSDSLKNSIHVSATKIRIAQQPAVLIEAGSIAPSVNIELTDTFNNLDLDTNLTITATASGSNLLNAPVSKGSVLGKVSFNNLVFTQALDPDTLLINAGGLPVVKSTKFKVKNSAFSDIIPTPGFAYTSNIPYQLYADSVGLTNVNSIPVFGITVRDGGAQGVDADGAATVLTSLKFNITNYQQIKTLALFDTTNTKLGEVIVNSALVQFPGLTISTPDNGTTKLILAATFKKQVNDNIRVLFKITEALSKSDTSCSGFTAVDAGGAVSSSYINENKISVTANKLRFVQQPSLTATGAVVFPAVSVDAIDTNNNTDLDGRILTIITNKSTFSTAAVTQVAVNPSTGRASFSNLVFNDTASQVQLTVSDGALTVTSDTFTIIQPVWYRSAKTGDWDSLNTWEYSTDTGNTWLASPSEIPYALKHGKITIRSGHTVTMRGTTASSRTLDETTIESNAVLILPVNADQKAIVNDGIGNDLVIYGTLRQLNNNISGGIQFSSAANASVMTGGIVELAANGYASDWAGNPHFDFQDGAVYLHNSTQINALGSGIFFPNAATNVVPVFRLGAGISYPSTTVDPMADLTINGIVEITAGKTFAINNGGNTYFRNGLKGAGNLNLSGNSTVSITAAGEISGTGTISINGNSSLQVAATATVSLLSDKAIYTNTNGAISVKGILNTYQNQFTGTASVSVNDEGTLMTAHSNGLKGTLNTSGTISFDNSASLVLNNQSVLQPVNAPSHLSIGKLTVNNPFGVSLNDTIIVQNTLDLAAGSLFTGTNGVVELTATASVTHFNSDRFISGRVLANIAQTTTLPVGKDLVYSPVTLTTDNDPSAFVVEYFTAVPSSLDTSAKTGSLKRIATSDAWYINRVSGNAAEPVSVSYHAALQSGENTQDLRLVTWNNNTWTSAGPAARNATAQSITSDPVVPSGYFAIGIDNACTTPAAPVATVNPVCNGTSASITANGSGTMNWYTTPTGGTALFTGNIFTTANLYLDTNFYVEATQLSCASSRVKVPVTVVNILSAPQVDQSLIRVCKNNTATFNAAATTGTINWYSNAALTSVIATGNTFNTGALSMDTVFYAVAQQSGCLGAPAIVEVDAKTPPQSPFTKDLSICAGNPATVLASSNYSMKWYTTATGTQSFSSASNITIPDLQNDTTLYVESFDGTCTSDRIAVHVTSMAVPSIPQLQTLGFACSGESMTLQTTGASARWFYSERDTLPASTGTSFNTGILNRSTVFFADAFNGSCASAKLSIPVSVVTKPSGFSLSLPETILRNDSASIQVDGPAADLYTWNFGPDAFIPVKTGRGPHYVQWHTAGTKNISLTVSNQQGPFACETTYDTSIIVLPLTGLDEQSLANTSLFTVYPNPANDLLNIQLELQHGSKGSIRITDLMGRVLWEDNIAHSTYHNTIAVDQFAAGMYTISAEINGERIVKKIIINKR